MKETVAQQSILLKGQQDQQIGMQTQISQLKSENDMVKGWNNDLKKKLEEVYKQQIDRRKSTIFVRNSVEELCENVEQIQITIEKKKSLLESEIDAEFDQREAIEYIENYHNENLKMFQEIEQLKNDNQVLQSQFDEYKACTQKEMTQLATDLLSLTSLKTHHIAQIDSLEQKIQKLELDV